jgi:hypothetical protein
MAGVERARRRLPRFRTVEGATSLTTATFFAGAAPVAVEDEASAPEAERTRPRTTR